MSKNLVVIGAGGHGKVIVDIAEQTKLYEKIVFLDDNKEAEFCMGYPVVGTVADIKNFIEGYEFFVAIGNCKRRMQIQEYLKSQGALIATLIHPMAVIGKCVKIGQGTVVMPGAVINVDTVIGEGCIINTCASVDHEGVISDYVHVSVGSHVCGAVHVGEATWIGAGATVANNISICANCILGMGAVVLNSIEEEGTYLGVPARKK